MNIRFFSRFAAVILLLLAPAIFADNLLVLNDGSAIEVDEMTLRAGRIEVRLPGNDQVVAYAVSDVDLEASGLVSEPRETTFETPQKTIRGGFEAAIAAPAGETETLTITDQDVGHVRKPAPVDDEEDSQTTPPAKTTALMVSNLQRQTTPGGPLTVTGTVTNSGDVAVTAIAITGDAQDSSGESIGRGTTGISSTLAAGEEAGFTITIPVNGAVSNVKVSAIAAMSEFTFEPVPAPQKEDNEDGEEEFNDIPENTDEDEFEQDFQE
jgi:hypothetical protein